jgi:hypothetical protein
VEKSGEGPREAHSKVTPAAAQKERRHHLFERGYI